MPTRIVPVHVHVEPLQDIGDRGDVAYLRLIAEPDSEGIHHTHVFRLVNASRLCGFQRILDEVDPCQVFHRKVGRNTERRVFIEILDELIV